MAIHREPTEKEKEIILKRHTKDGKIRCYVNDHPIEDGNIEYHHIKPFSLGGETDINNLAPVCREHHRRIGILSIQEYRDRLELEKFFKNSNTVRLDDILINKIGNNYGKKLNNEVKGDKIYLYFDNSSQPLVLPLYTCPASGFKYFYIRISIEYIKNDIDLQPRPLEIKRLWELYRHLLTHTQLAPAVCRLKDSQVLLFDGQHKTAAQIWAGRDAVECKIYIDPDIKILKDTNLTAHDKLRQMPFYTSILINKWADLFKEEWDEYKEIKGVKSEKGFMTFLIEKGKTRAEASKMFWSFIYDSILEDDKNKIINYIAERNRSRLNPLTTNAIKVTFFKNFLTPPPLDLDLDKSDELRELERQNMINLINIIVEETLENKWDPDNKDGNHKLSVRLYSIGALKAWSSMFKDVVAQVLNLYDSKERNKLLLRKISEDKWNTIRERLKRLISHELWSDPSSEIDSRLRVNNETDVREFLTSRGLTVNWILGGQGA